MISWTIPKPEKKKWKLEIWQSGKITRDLCLSPDCSDREKRCLKVNKGIFVDRRKAVWHNDVISSKMRETMLVGGKLSSRSPHYEGSERDDSVKVVKRGLDPFWWRKLKQRHEGCLMSWKWRYRDHPCRSQNLPQNICNYYINELIFELSSWWQIAKQTKTRQGPTVWNCALRCQLIYR